MIIFSLVSHPDFKTDLSTLCGEAGSPVTVITDITCRAGSCSSHAGAVTCGLLLVSCLQWEHGYYRATDSHSAANTKVKVDNSHNSHARYLGTTRCDSVVFYSEFPATLSPPRSSASILSEHVYVLTADLLSGSRLGAALGAAPPRQPPTAGKSVQKRLQ